MTTIAYIGNYTAPWCTEVHIARDLEHLGHTVQKFQEPLRADDDKYAFMQRVEAWCTEHRPDVLLFTRTHGLPPEAIAMWRRLEALGIRTASYHLDLYVGLDRERGILDDPFWRTQYVFTPDGDPASEEFFQRAGINHHWISPGVVSDECTRGMFRDEYNYDVVFVGSYGYHPEWPWRTQLIDYLANRYGKRFKRFGGDVAPGPVRGQDLNDLYATARVVVGDSLHLPGHTRYWTDRYFETIGRGGFLIAPIIEGLDAFLVDQEHYVGYNHPLVPNDPLSVSDALYGVGDLVDYWLEHPAGREQIATTGQAHVAARHTYKHRLARALEIMELPAREVVGVYVPEAQDAVVNISWEPVIDAAAHIATELPIVAQFPNGIDRLELGSGTHPTPGFTHLDINPNSPDVDIVGTAWPLNLPDESVGEIRAVDVLEHLSYWDTPKILADWFRVLRPGGLLYVQVPDAERIMRWFIDTPDRLVERLPANLPQTPLAGAAWRLLGGHHDGVYVSDDDDFRWNAHYALFSVESLTDALVAAGFVINSLTTNSHPNLLCYARKP
jgi:hypothetical protein